MSRRTAQEDPLLITHRRNRIDGIPERGAALVELALVLPLLVVIMAGAADFARVFYTANVLNNAARAGAQYGAQAPAFYDKDAAMRAIAQSVADGNLSSPLAVINSFPTCECVSDAGVTGAPAAPLCTGVCAGGNHLVIHVTVSATKTFVPIFSVPGISTSIALTRSATLRAQ